MSSMSLSNDLKKKVIATLLARAKLFYLQNNMEIAYFWRLSFQTDNFAHFDFQKRIKAFSLKITVLKVRISPPRDFYFYIFAPFNCLNSLKPFITHSLTTPPLSHLQAQIQVSDFAKKLVFLKMTIFKNHD